MSFKSENNKFRDLILSRFFFNDAKITKIKLLLFKEPKFYQVYRTIVS